MVEFAQVYYYKLPSWMNELRKQLIIDSITKAISFIINLCINNPKRQYPIIIEYIKPSQNQSFSITIRGTVSFQKQIDHDLQPQSNRSLEQTIKKVLSPFAYFNRKGMLIKIISFFIMASPHDKIKVKIKKEKILESYSDSTGGATFTATLECDFGFFKTFTDFIEKYAKNANYNNQGRISYQVDLLDFQARYCWE